MISAIVLETAALRSSSLLELVNSPLSCDILSLKISVNSDISTLDFFTYSRSPVLTALRFPILTHCSVKLDSPDLTVHLSMLGSVSSGVHSVMHLSPLIENWVYFKSSELFYSLDLTCANLKPALLFAALDKFLFKINSFE